MPSEEGRSLVPINAQYLYSGSYHMVKPVSVGAKGSNSLALITISVDVPWFRHGLG